MSALIQKNTPPYWGAIGSLFVGSLISFAILYCTQPLLPTFSREYGLSPSFASLSVSLPTASMALAMLFVAGFSDMIGRKKTMFIALLGAALLTFISAFVKDFSQLLFFRFLQGIFLAGFPSIAMAYLNEEFDPAITGLAMGIYVSGTSIGGLLGRLAVSTLTDLYSWHLALGSWGALCLLAAIAFWLALPAEQSFAVRAATPRQLGLKLLQLLQNPKLFRLYLIGFAIMGSFVTMYNYIGYPLMSPPYNLTQTAIGALFFIYLVGTFSSTYMGRRADRCGHAKTLTLSLSVMLIGSLATLITPLYLKLFGLAVFTFGFFASHSVVSSWIGKCSEDAKAQAASLYLLFYYLGAALLGAIGGFFLRSFGWSGIIALLITVLALALVIAKNLQQSEAEHALNFSCR